LAKYAGSTYAYVKKRKNRKSDDEKGGWRRAEKGSLIIDKEKQDPFQFVDV